MPTKQTFLKPVMAGKRWAGTYECSRCGIRFKPDLNDPGKLSREFTVHHLDKHGRRQGKEDFSQAAARIVREATEKD